MVPPTVFVSLLSFLLFYIQSCAASNLLTPKAAAMESKLASFTASLNVSSDTASTITAKLSSSSDVVSLLETNSTSKRSTPQLAALACWTAELCLGSDVIASSSNATLVEVNWSQACWMPAQCFASPKTTSDVAVILKIVGFLQTPFAIRSGGHSPNPFWSSIDSEGILISLSNLDQITVSLDNSVASIGPGQRWGPVYEALDSYGVGVIGGRIPQVGVGGLILGGGLSHFSAQFGLAADNVKNFEVVLADGSVVDANANENSDLFWALKGGGPNFGIVTRFDLYTRPVRNVWFTVVAFAPSELPAILAAFTHWQNEGAQTDPRTSVLLNILPTGVSFGLVYSENTQDYPEAFAPFAALENGMVMVPPTNATLNVLSNILASVFSQTPARHLYRSAASKVDLTLYNETTTYFMEKVTAVQASGVNFNMTFTLQTISPSLVQQGIDNGGNPIGIPLIPHQWWTTVTDWTDSSNDAEVLSTVADIGNQFQIRGTPRGTFLPFLFMNDCYADQNPLSEYPAANLERLKEIASKYDPTELFQKVQKDGFLLSKV